MYMYVHIPQPPNPPVAQDRAQRQERETLHSMEVITESQVFSKSHYQVILVCVWNEEDMELWIDVLSTTAVTVFV